MDFDFFDALIDIIDVFFDLLSPELNLDGVVFFFANVYTSIFKAI